jgi:hypothetical protein
MNCEGYRKLQEAVAKDKLRDCGHDYAAKLTWIVERSKHYAEKTGLTPEAILDAWESRRNYWYMNYYQESCQPKIDDGSVRVFETVQDFIDSVGTAGFRCPFCKGVSKSPYKCDAGTLVKLMNSKGKKKEPCDWKVYGLFGHLGQGISVFVKDKMAIEKIFMPIAWETNNENPDIQSDEKGL